MAVDKIVAAMTEKANNGELTTDQYNSMSYDCATINSGKKANEFIMKYQHLCG